MFCPYCGSENKNGVAFCSKCGKKLAPSTPQAPPPVKAEKPAAPKKPSIMTKANVVKGVLALLLILLYAGVSLLILLLLNREDSIVIKTAYDSSVSEYWTLKELLDGLVSGNRIFNPTVVSKALGLGTYILLYSVPVFAGIALVGTFITKKAASLHIVFSVLSVLAAAATVAVTPISMAWIPGFKQATAISVGVIFEDIASFTYMLPIVLAAVVLGLVIVSCIVAGLFNKRRA